MIERTYQPSRYELELPRYLPTVEKLREELKQIRFPSQHPSFLGGGEHFDGYAINNTIIRLPKDFTLDPIDWEGRIEALKRSQDIPHLQHLEAFKKGDFIITDILPGRSVRELSSEQIESISDKQLSNLFETATSLANQELVIDTEGDNTLYDPAQGFAFYDLSLKSQASVDIPYTPADAYAQLVEGVTKPSPEAAPEDQQVRQELFVRAESILHDYPDGQSRQRALTRLADTFSERWGKRIAVENI